ncbi:MAG: imidazole glycerol phosphate synthase subunit HisH [Bacteroidales bacterium]|jgi:glutamine amidotransferase|nr:imidazole glycerol phosphate synthase subunit HisH [Bacteroidales bacterium]MDZ4058728.1 imidazole glycerol phosphate synthase subunit HisH [Bacteroidales bacterium]
MTAIVDYGTGNIFSLCNAIEKQGNEFVVTCDPKLIYSADHIILPGVGEASSVMREIEIRSLTDTLKKVKSPVLGICIGMQVMCSFSEEGETDTLGIFKNRVNKIKSDGVKIPHMGWNRVENLKGPLYDGIDEGEWFYFVHSYAPDINEDTISFTNYSNLFSSSLNRFNFYGTQFHPEKSGAAGERFLRNFFMLNK